MIRLAVFISLLLASVCMLQAASARETVTDQVVGGDIELLPPQEAFKLTAWPDGEQVRVQFEIAPGYYLYRDRLSVTAAAGAGQLKLGDIRKPAGVTKRDPLFGVVDVYRQHVILEVPVKTLPSDGQVQLVVTSQGCADLGVCYPPQTQQLQIALNSSSALPGVSAEQASDKFALLEQLFGAAPAADGSAEFPPPDEVFRLDATALDANNINVRFTISEGYYLYRKRMHFSLTGGDSGRLAAIELPAGTLKEDPYFGAMQVFYQEVNVRIPLRNRRPGRVDLQVEYQGCAEAGLCYPPLTKHFQVALPGTGSSGQGTLRVATGSAADMAVQGQLSQTDQLARSLVQGSWFLVLASFFGWGLLLAFTPCVLPMVPILATLIAGQGEKLGGRRGFSLAAVYVLAMALTYTGAGIAAALLGQNLQAMFQHPLVLVGFSGVFIALSLAMFGVYELQMPSAWQTRLQGLSQSRALGGYGGVAVTGSLSALIVGPCVAAPLAAALIVIGGSGDPLRGGLALFFLSLGMGTPLLAVGAFGDRIMPKLGPWMILVKQLFGVMLLAVAIYLLSRILPDPLVMVLWSGLLILTAVVFAWHSGEGSGLFTVLRWRRSLSALALVYAGLLAVGAVSGANDPLNPLARVLGEEPHRLTFVRVANAQELDRMVAQANRRGQTVMLDFYADWCVTCKQMEAETFSAPGVRKALQNTMVLQVDMTAYNNDDKALLARYQLVGPPAILFFNTRGREIRSRRVIGFMAAVEFQRLVEQAVKI